MTIMSESEPNVDDSVTTPTSSSTFTTTPQDGTFNKALSHAIYLARLSDAEPESGHTERGG
jgi:hypothetical protein